MSRVDALPPDLRRRFRSGRPSLDLAHTGGEGELARWEILHTADDLGHYLGIVLDLPGPVATTDADLIPARALRTALTTLAYGLAGGTDPTALAPPAAPVAPLSPDALDAAAVAVLNTAAAAPPLVPALNTTGGTQHHTPTAVGALSTLARDAIDLFGGPLATRIRVCAAGNCGLLFVDASRPGKRRWCSMETCGNRAKVRDHRSR